jgi:RHS repeat-associated protein
MWRWDLLANTATGSNAFGEQLPASFGVNFSLRFPGQIDDGNGISYNYFRDYEPGTGRYLESDPIGLKGGISTFGYVGGMPLMNIDPLGLSWAKAVNKAVRRALKKEGFYCKQGVPCPSDDGDDCGSETSCAKDCLKCCRQGLGSISRSSPGELSICNANCVFWHPEDTQCEGCPK